MAGKITHSWNGTVLTITSDSGTSSADLKGDMGVRGPQGVAGIVDGTLYYNRGNPPTAAEVGAAPAGYGLGKAERITTDKLDSTITPGFYDISATMTVNNTTANYWYLFVFSYGAGTNYCTQTIINCSANQLKQERYYRSGEWTDWAYVNPPMELGVEYRTTEKYNGKPVYVKAVDMGALPNTALKNAAHNISNATIISYEIYVNNGTIVQQFPFITSSGTVAGKAHITSVNVGINTFSDISAYSGTAFIKYIKN